MIHKNNLKKFNQSKFVFSFCLKNEIFLPIDRSSKLKHLQVRQIERPVV